LDRARFGELFFVCDLTIETSSSRSGDDVLVGRLRAENFLRFDGSLIVDGSAVALCIRYVQLATMSKPEFSPILSAGFHEFTIDELARTFVEPFVHSQRRQMLFGGLRNFVSQIVALGITGELWFDGSFVCTKNEPDDIDLVVVVDADSLAHFTVAQHALVERAFDNTTARAMFGCDVYCVLSSDVVGVSYWRGWFGFRRDGKTPKGIGYILL
jgi:hypothetical protein